MGLMDSSGGGKLKQVREEHFVAADTTSNFTFLRVYFQTLETYNSIFVILLFLF